MRNVLITLFVVTMLTHIAHADDGFVVDTRDPAAQGKSYTFADGQLVEGNVSDPTAPLLVVSLPNQPVQNCLMLLSLHPGETYTQLLSNAAGEQSAESGVIQVREFSVAPKEHAPVAPETADMLARGKRFVMGNVELVIYAPGSDRFLAEVFTTPAAPDALGSVKLPYIGFDPAQTPPPGCTDWISGSL